MPSGMTLPVLVIVACCCRVATAVPCQLFSNGSAVCGQNPEGLNETNLTSCCFIGDTCVPHKSFKPTNSCLLCDVTKGDSKWTEVSDCVDTLLGWRIAIIVMVLTLYFTVAALMWAARHWEKNLYFKRRAIEKALEHSSEDLDSCLSGEYSHSFLLRVFLAPAQRAKSLDRSQTNACAGLAEVMSLSVLPLLGQTTNGAKNQSSSDKHTSQFRSLPPGGATVKCATEVEDVPANSSSACRTLSDTDQDKNTGQARKDSGVWTICGSDLSISHSPSHVPGMKRETESTRL